MSCLIFTNQISASFSFDHNLVGQRWLPAKLRRLTKRFFGVKPTGFLAWKGSVQNRNCTSFNLFIPSYPARRGFTTSTQYPLHSVSVSLSNLLSPVLLLCQEPGSWRGSAQMCSVFWSESERQETSWWICWIIFCINCCYNVQINDNKENWLAVTLTLYNCNAIGGSVEFF